MGLQKFFLQDKFYNNNMGDPLHMQHQAPSNYDAAKEFFKNVSFVEQPFGLSWLTKVTYTLPDDVLETQDSIFDIPGINILDLAEHD